jgi:hypothetical protein
MPDVLPMDVDQPAESSRVGGLHHRHLTGTAPRAPHLTCGTQGLPTEEHCKGCRRKGKCQHRLLLCTTFSSGASATYDAALQEPRDSSAEVTGRGVYATNACTAGLRTVEFLLVYVCYGHRVGCISSKSAP